MSIPPIIPASALCLAIGGAAAEYKFEPIYKVMNATLKGQGIHYLGRKTITCGIALTASAFLPALVCISYLVFKWATTPKAQKISVVDENPSIPAPTPFETQLMRSLKKLKPIANEQSEIQKVIYYDPETITAHASIYIEGNCICIDWHQDSPIKAKIESFKDKYKHPEYPFWEFENKAFEGKIDTSDQLIEFISI